MKPYYICNWDNIVIIDDLEEAFGRDMVSIICVIHTAYWESDIIFNAAETSCNKAPAAAAKLLQSCPTLCDPIDGSPPGFLVPGILQARTLEWVAISFSNAWKWKVKVKSLSRVRLCDPRGLPPTRLLCPWDFPGKSTRVGRHCLLHWFMRHQSLINFLQIKAADPFLPVH